MFSFLISLIACCTWLRAGELLLLFFSFVKKLGTERPSQHLELAADGTLSSRTVAPAGDAAEKASEAVRPGQELYLILTKKHAERGGGFYVNDSASAGVSVRRERRWSWALLRYWLPVGDLGDWTCSEYLERAHGCRREEHDVENRTISLKIYSLRMAFHPLSTFPDRPLCELLEFPLEPTDAYFYRFPFSNYSDVKRIKRDIQKCTCFEYEDNPRYDLFSFQPFMSHIFFE